MEHTLARESSSAAFDHVARRMKRALKILRTRTPRRTLQRGWRFSLRKDPLSLSIVSKREQTIVRHVRGPAMHGEGPTDYHDCSIDATGDRLADLRRPVPSEARSFLFGAAIRQTASSSSLETTTTAPSRSIGRRVHPDACVEPKIFKMSLWHFSRRRRRRRRDPRVPLIRRFCSSPSFRPRMYRAFLQV